MTKYTGDNLDSIIPYPGGKSIMAPQLVKHIAPHDCWIELFSGACWVTLAKQPSLIEVINDKDLGLINFWLTIRHKPQEFIEQSEFAVRSRYVFNNLKSNYGRPRGEIPDVGAAWEYWYLIQNSFTGSMSYPRWSYNKASKRSCRRSHYADLLELEPRIMDVYNRFRYVDIECLDFRECVDRYDNEKAFFFCDPPYWDRRSGPSDYLVTFTEQDHLDLCEILCSIQGKFLLTYEDSLPVRDAYGWAHIKPVRFRYSVPHGGSAGDATMGEELIISNYDINESLGPLFTGIGQDAIII